MKKTSLILTVLLVLFIFSGCAGLSGADWEHPTSDDDIAALASSRLNNDAMIARATLSVSVDNGMATRGEKEYGINMDKIVIDKVDGKTIMTVNITYKNKEKSYPFVVAETNLDSLPDKIQLNSQVEEK